MVEHILNGGQLPGLTKETLDSIVKQYMEKMYALAAHIQEIPTDIPLTARDYQNAHRFLPPLTKLPKRFVTGVMEGKPLPHLSPDQTRVIKVSIIYFHLAFCF